MTPDAPGHDIVVIGASAGGVEALSELVRGLPGDLPASLFVVMHMQAGVSSFLPDILSKVGPLRAAHPVHGEAIVPGRIYVAPPDNHLMLRPGYMTVLRGPKENGHRPAVDALFRSAAIAYGARVVGVVLTGYHDDGTAGLLSIKARGGLAVVQDPADALVMNMPRTAIQHVAVDHVASLRDIGGLLARLVRTPAARPPVHLPGAMAEIEGDEPGFSADIVCPICQGRLTETEVNGFQMFRCHVGHSFSLETVAAEQAEEVERALWAAARALEESAALAARMSAVGPSAEMRDRFAEKQQSQFQQAELIRRILLSGGVLSRSDVEERPEELNTGHGNPAEPT
ncbi:MAG TPA: chemotaxis protein CheB [Polyangia bacterium]|jgi:two-component system chemotaxis response regulator CheB